MSILDTLSALMTLLVLAVAISYYVSHFILTAVLSVQLIVYDTIMQSWRE